MCVHFYDDNAHQFLQGYDSDWLNCNLWVRWVQITWLSNMWKMKHTYVNSELLRLRHCVKSICIRSFSDLHLVQMRENADQKIPNTDTFYVVRFGVRGRHQPSHEINRSFDLQKTLYHYLLQQYSNKFGWIVTLVARTPHARSRGSYKMNKSI